MRDRGLDDGGYRLSGGRRLGDQRGGRIVERKTDSMDVPLLGPGPATCQRARDGFGPWTHIVVDPGGDRTVSVNSLSQGRIQWLNLGIVQQEGYFRQQAPFRKG